jgi:hypothetical protein
MLPDLREEETRDDVNASEGVRIQLNFHWNSHTDDCIDGTHDKQNRTSNQKDEQEHSRFPQRTPCAEKA